MLLLADLLRRRPHAASQRECRSAGRERGETIDWISIYKHGHDGEAENPWSYVFLSVFRENPAAIRNELRKRGGADFLWGNIELAAFALVLFVMFLLNWRYVIFFFLPFFYLGHCFSYLNGYFRHYGANRTNRLPGA